MLQAMSGLALSTDLYELTMVAGYYTAGLTGRASFELFVRDLPINRSFLVAAGLEQALDYLENLRFADEHQIVERRGVRDNNHRLLNSRLVSVSRSTCSNV